MHSIIRFGLVVSKGCVCRSALECSGSTRSAKSRKKSNFRFETSQADWNSIPSKDKVDPYSGYAVQQEL